VNPSRIEREIAKMTVGVELDQTRHLLVGIQFDKESKELLSWALVKVAEPGDHVVAVHVCRNSGYYFSEP